MRFNKKVIAVALLAGGLLVGASAFTVSLTGASSYPPTIGYAALTATGATVSSISYSYDTSDPPNLTGITVVTSGNTASENVYIGFNGSGTMSECSGSGTYSSPSTTYTCTGLDEAASAITSVDLAIH